MKKVVMFFICLFAVFTGFSQNRYVGNICIPYDEAKQDYGYTVIDTVPQTLDSTIYKNLKCLLSGRFNNSRYAIDISPKEFQIPGYITGSYEMQLLGKQTIPVSFTVTFNVSVKIRPDKYKIDIFNFKLTTNQQGYGQEYALKQLFEYNVATIDAIGGLGKKNAMSRIIKVNEQVADKINEQVTTLIAEMHNSTHSRISGNDDNW